ncbi:UNVERIFIED_CONTAM: hypothetical protein RMT77_004925 [Armadillidium vulgare]
MIRSCTNTIHIFSIIPRLSSLLSKELPNANVIDVLKDKFGRDVSNEEVSELRNAEIILGDANLIAQVYDKVPRVSFIQCTWAGVEKLIDTVKNGSIPSYPITRFGDQTFSQLMAEYVTCQIISHERGFLKAREHQLQSTWSHEGKIGSYRCLKELTIGVLGVGVIGSEVVRALKFFGCRVLGLGRSPSAPTTLPLDQYFSEKNVHSFLEDCDYIVNILPSTPETKGLLGRDTLSYAKKEPVFINVGRGDIICEQDLLEALEKSWISVAILDVFNTEPLPTSSPLWLHPKVLVTPHTSALSRPVDVVTSFLSNLELYLKNQPLKNVINFERGY